MTTIHEIPEAVTRNIVATVGTALYAFTQLGVVAWVTVAWVCVQMVRFCLSWWREESYRRRWMKNHPDDTFPGDLR